MRPQVGSRKTDWAVRGVLLINPQNCYGPYLLLWAKAHDNKPSALAQATVLTQCQLVLGWRDPKTPKPTKDEICVHVPINFNVLHHSLNAKMKNEKPDLFLFPHPLHFFLHILVHIPSFLVNFNTLSSNLLKFSYSRGFGVLGLF